MYRLSTGGWIPKESVQPLEEQVNIRNRVSGVSFEQAGSGEYYTFHGTANTMFRAETDGEKLYVKLFNTTGNPRTMRTAWRTAATCSTRST